MSGAAQRRAGIEAGLLRFIVEELLEELYDGRDPLAGGAVDSLGVEQLVDHIEERYGVRLGDEDMVQENFESIGALAGLVDQRLGDPVS